MNRRMVRPIFPNPPVEYGPDYFRTVFRSLDQFVTDVMAVGDVMTQQVGLVPQNAIPTQGPLAFITTANGNIYLSAGASFDGTNWTAKSNKALVIALDVTVGKLIVNYNIGLTPGGVFTPTQTATLG